MLFTTYFWNSMFGFSTTTSATTARRLSFGSRDTAAITRSWRSVRWVRVAPGKNCRCDNKNSRLGLAMRIIFYIKTTWSRRWMFFFDLFFVSSFVYSLGLQTVCGSGDAKNEVQQRNLLCWENTNEMTFFTFFYCRFRGLALSSLVLKLDTCINW